MVKENFFTGEPVQTGSPENFTTEQEAVQNAGFGMYDYDPGMRAMMAQQPVSIFPGGYGYNANPAFSMFMNPPNSGGMFYNPYLYQQQLYQQQMAYQQQYQQMMQQNVQSYIKPVSWNSDYLPPEGWEDKVQQLMMHYWNKEQENVGEQSAKNNGVYNPFLNTNYYGMPYYNPYSYNYGLNSEINRKIEELQNEAKENRISLSMQLSKLAHNYVQDHCSDQEIYDRYHGKVIENPGGVQMTYADIMEQQRYSGLIPFDNSQQYREFSEAVSKEHQSIIPKDANMKDAFSKMGTLGAHYEIEEEKHRRRNGGALYDSENNAYKVYVREKAAERYNQSQNKQTLKQMVQGVDQVQNGDFSNFPTLAQSARLCEDGSLTITCPFGSQAGQPFTVNAEESKYEADRERFQNFIDSIPQSIYLDSPNAGD